LGLSRNTVIFEKPWFAAPPKNAKKASATITFDGVVSDGDEVAIGDFAYEFDMDSNLENGLATSIDMTDYLTAARATLTFIGVPVAAETVTIGSGDDAEVYELVAAAEDVADPANIPVVLGTTLTADNAVTKLALEISSNSELVDAVASTTNDTVLLVAKAGGIGANTMAVATTCTNASFGVGVTTLSGGADTISATDAATLLKNAITANVNEVVTAAVGTGGDNVVVAYKLVGTDGNSVPVSTDATNGSWGEDITKLSGGQFSTPAKTASLIEINGTIYLTYKGGDKFAESLWYSAALTQL
jgi:hypothetical protein